MSTTPSSDISFYFDAPTDQSMASQQDLPPPIAGPFNLQDHTVKEDTYASDKPELETSPKMPVPHPNGSEGWLPTEDAPPVSSMRAGTPQAMGAGTRSVQPGPEDGPIQTDSEFKNVSNTPRRSNTAASKRSSLRLAKSISGRNTHADTEGRTLDDSAFFSGAGTTGPLATAEYDEELHARRLEANQNLTPAQREKIAKEESLTGNRLSKIIKQEAQTEKAALSVAIRELENMQTVQKQSVKSESNLQASHARLLNTFKKKEAAYLNAQKNYETALAELNAETKTLETLRANSREATGRMQDKATEVDTLRKTLAVDNREREVKLTQLNDGPSRSRLWCF